ncbi:MAG: hypothetical protein MHM6MM_004079 [Cercozoa sp. M6MM]
MPSPFFPSVSLPCCISLFWWFRIVHLLLDRGADRSFSDTSIDGATAIVKAARQHHWAVVRSLLPCSDEDKAIILEELSGTEATDATRGLRELL